MTNVKTLLHDHSSKVVARLEHLLNEERVRWQTVAPAQVELLDRITTFIQAGKIWRGSLVMMGYEWLETDQTQPTTAVEIVAASVEILHASFLIHDDIIDQDELRRGQPSMYAQYQTVASQGRWRQPRHAGQSLGLLAGDFGYFWAFQWLNQAELAPDLSRSLSQVLAREAINTGLGQWVDVELGLKTSPGTLEEVEFVNQYKTARYTFSLPLLLAGQLRGLNAEQLAALDAFSETLGIVFQLRDDELGLFSDEATLGKPIGSDIKAGKQTWWWQQLMAKAQPSQAQQLQAWFGSPDLTTAQLAQIRTWLEEWGVRKAGQAEMQRRLTQARQLMTKIPFRAKALPEVEAIIELTWRRTT